MDPSAPPQPRGRGHAPGGTLFVVATPIGNLEDITLRALRILKEVALVAAEDTRRTGNLLRHYAIGTPLVSLHEHNEHGRSAELLRRLASGDSIALVSDAGTPGISDPGATLVRQARGSGFRVEPVPGPSAVTAALSASGLPLERFAFAGFPPVRSSDRKRWFNWVASLADVPVVAFEAPHRVRRTLGDCHTFLVNRPIVVARELTKSHEQWSELAPGDTRSAESVPERGEFVLVIGQKTEIGRPAHPPSDTDIAEAFGRLTSAGAPRSADAPTPPSPTRRDIIRQVAEELGVAPKVVYDALERAKNGPA